jgi:hypothetical protein
VPYYFAVLAVFLRHLQVEVAAHVAQGAGKAKGDP